MAYRSRERWPRGDVIYCCREFLMKKRLIDREKGMLNIVPIRPSPILNVNLLL